MNFADILGSIGVSILLAAFVLNLLKFIKTTGFMYSLLNFIGAALSCYASMLIHYRPFVVLEGVWTLVSLIGVINWLRRSAFTRKDSTVDAGRV
jgi:hypothetical protein